MTDCTKTDFFSIPIIQEAKPVSISIQLNPTKDLIFVPRNPSFCYKTGPVEPRMPERRNTIVIYGAKLRLREEEEVVWKGCSRHARMWINASSVLHLLWYNSD